MATLLHSESRRLYSWWWDSHISPKNSKWLQENLTDMDANVKAMIRLIEEDADSFARRAEMYYKKHPEVTKLVEEFNRAYFRAEMYYRALAERYEPATAELHDAHKTMAQALDNQMPPSDESCSDAESHTSEIRLPNHALHDKGDLQEELGSSSSTNQLPLRMTGNNAGESNTRVSKAGLKQLNQMFASKGSTEPQVVRHNGHNFQLIRNICVLKPPILWLSERDEKLDSELQNLRKRLNEMEAEKEAFFLKYQNSLEKLSSLEKELSSNQCLQNISSLEKLLSVSQQDAEGHKERAAKAEIAAHNLEQQLSRLAAEREVSLLQCEQYLKKISALENKISVSEDYARTLDERMNSSETEVKVLKRALDDLKEEKETASRQYEQCLEKIARMETEISHAQDELVMANAKLVTAEERCAHLEQSNHSLQFEADKLVHKIVIKDQELAETQDELKKLQTLMNELTFSSNTSMKNLEDQLSGLKEMKEKLAEVVSQKEEQSSMLEKEIDHLREEIKGLSGRYQGIMRQLEAVGLDHHSLEFTIKEFQEENAKLREGCEKDRNKIEALHEKLSYMDELQKENFSFLIECEQYEEASKLSDKLIAELEGENLEQQVEVEFMNNEINKLRAGIRKVLMALQIDQDEERILIVDILARIEDLKTSVFENKDKKRQLLVQNSVLLTLLKQLSLESEELKENFMQELKSRKDQLAMHEQDKQNLIIQETIAFNILSSIFESFKTEKFLEIKRLVQDICHLQVVNSETREEVGKLAEKSQLKDVENLRLNGLVEKLAKELHESKDLNDELNHQILLGNDLLRSEAQKLSETEDELKNSQNFNMKLSDIVEELKMEGKETTMIKQNLENENLELKEKCLSQENEIQCLSEVNENLKSEVDLLNEEIDKCKIREECLSLELQERRDEVELWEAEATTFYFDLQISSIREVLYERKVQELVHACENARDEDAEKDMEIEELRERVSFLETEVREMEAELYAYKPAIAALREDVESLKHIVLPQGKETTTRVHQRSCNVYKDEILDLQEIGAMMKVVEKAVIEEKKKLSKEAAEEHVKDFESEGNSHQEATMKDGITDNVEARKNKPDNGMLMKDIPLDRESDTSLQRRGKRSSDQNLIDGSPQSPSDPQVEYPQLEQSHSSIRERIRRGRKGKILERIDSDVVQLTGLLTSVEDLKKRIEVNIFEMARNNEYDTVEKHIKEVEEDIFEQLNISGQLKKNLERSPSFFEQMPSVDIEATGNIITLSKLREQVQRGSEKVQQLQFEVQSIRHVVLKLEDEKKTKGKNTFSESSKRRVILKDFICRSGKRREGRKKPCYCGCMRPSSTHGD